jgi:hypothetical protein
MCVSGFFLVGGKSILAFASTGILDFGSCEIHDHIFCLTNLVTDLIGLGISHPKSFNIVHQVVYNTALSHLVQLVLVWSELAQCSEPQI